jgi:hypothetical protein
MIEFIEIRVQLRGNERLLRLRNTGPEWYAALLIPGREDLLTGECPSPSPRGAILPKLEMKDMELKIQASSGKVESIGMAMLIASGHVHVKDGHVVVALRGIIRDYQDGVEDRIAEPGQAQILEFPTGRNRDGYER